MKEFGGVSYYINGNYFVSINSYTGTKKKRALRVGESLIAEFPDSIDLKITNSCSWNCPFCHESSNPRGKTFDIRKTQEILEQLPKVGIELAIGGGNLFDIPDQTLKFLKWANKHSFITRITLNQKDMEKIFYRTNKIYRKIAEEVGGIGISINRYIENPIKTPQYTYRINNLYAKSVFHVIIGVLPVNNLKKILEDKEVYKKILILGFKQFGRASGMEIKHLDEWKSIIRKFIKSNNSNKTVGFDNLAIEQLGLKDFMDDETWDSSYFGNEFSSSMYIDAVKGEFAPTSRSRERVSWDSIKLLDYFNNNKNEF